MYPSVKLLTDVGVDSVRVSMAKTTCRVVYRGCFDKGPSALNDTFQAYVPTLELRSDNQLLVNIPHYRNVTEFAHKNIAVQGGYYWHMLPHEIKSSETIDLFKQKLTNCNDFG